MQILLAKSTQVEGCKEGLQEEAKQPCVVGSSWEWRAGKYRIQIGP